MVSKQQIRSTGWGQGGRASPLNSLMTIHFLHLITAREGNVFTDLCLSIRGGGWGLGLCPGGLSWGSLSKGVLCPGGSLSRGSVGRGGSLSRGSLSQRPPYGKERAVRILLEGILVFNNFPKILILLSQHIFFFNYLNISLFFNQKRKMSLTTVKHDRK